MTVGRFLSDAIKSKISRRQQTFDSWIVEILTFAMPKVTKKSAPKNTNPPQDNSEVVAAVKRQHDEFKRIEACDILQENLNRRKRSIEESLFQYETSTWDPDRTSVCKITQAHNDIWAINPALYRDSYMLYRIRHDPETNYTLYDMKAYDQTYYTLLFCSYYKLIPLSLVEIVTENVEESALTGTPMTSKMTTCPSIRIKIIRSAKRVTEQFWLKLNATKTSENLRMELPKESGRRSSRNTKKFVKLKSMEKCLEKDAREQLSLKRGRRRRPSIVNINHLRWVTHLPVLQSCVGALGSIFVQTFKPCTSSTTVTKKMLTKKQNDFLGKKKRSEKKVKRRKKKRTNISCIYRYCILRSEKNKHHKYDKRYINKKVTFFERYPFKKMSIILAKCVFSVEKKFFEISFIDQTDFFMKRGKACLSDDQMLIKLSQLFQQTSSGMIFANKLANYDSYKLSFLPTPNNKRNKFQCLCLCLFFENDQEKSHYYYNARKGQCTVQSERKGASHQCHYWYRQARNGTCSQKLRPLIHSDDTLYKKCGLRWPCNLRVVVPLHISLKEERRVKSSSSAGTLLSTDKHTDIFMHIIALDLERRKVNYNFYEFFITVRKKAI